MGCVPLYLLDANIPENPGDFREITAQLYSGDRRMRLRQELLLGIGGFRALTALGYEPHVCHINEGHAAFLALGRLEYLMQSRGLDLDTALEVVARTNVFTTHTPVPAGNETFPADLVRPHLQAALNGLGVPPDTILAWGQPADGGPGHEMSMTILGLRMAAHSNGVSHLHGRVARRMWSHLWPGRPEDEITIGHVTNGVHVSSWLSPDNTALYDRYLGPQWREHPADPRVLQQVLQIPDDELWRAHELNRSRMVRIVRDLMEKQYQARNAPRAEIEHAKAVLDHDTLTVGFARRFVTYKRGTLLLKDPQRLESLLTNEGRPVQIVFAGKAHPADDHGKDLIRQIVHFARTPNLRRRVVFVENYDIALGRSLVQGVDVWLNTPMRPQEACGTSGMKAAVNGVLNASVLDGWWCEGYHRDCGWAIGHGEEYDDIEYQNTVESQALYNLLENEIVPAFYDRPSGDLPGPWIKMMRASIQMALGRFTSQRMVAEYKSLFYDPACRQYEALLADDARQARGLVGQRARLHSLWGQVRLRTPAADKEISVLHVGDTFTVSTSVSLGQLKPEEVDVEVYHGPVDSQNRITQSHVEKMSIAEDHGGGNYTYRHEVTCPVTGRFGFTTRVIPRGEEWRGVIPGFLTWADGT
jgi:starch phosphorylase